MEGTQDGLPSGGHGESPVGVTVSMGKLLDGAESMIFLDLFLPQSYGESGHYVIPSCLPSFSLSSSLKEISFSISK